MSMDGGDGYRVDFDPKLVEECVLLAIDSSPADERHQFRRERDILYELNDSEARASSFRDLHGRWFVRLGIPEPTFHVLREQPALAESISGCIVVSALSAKDEGADLHRNRGRDPSSAASRPALVIRTRAGTLLDQERLFPFLRHELLHVADMLDPEFGYQPELPRLDGGPAYEGLFQERYRVLWDCTIDGRLSARGMLPPGGEERRRQEFLATFRLLSSSAYEHFERFFKGSRPRHEELVSFAASPGGKGCSLENAGSGRCPLCQFPTPNLRPGGISLEKPVVSAIQRDFPAWHPDLGLCLQCADLYASRLTPLDI